MSRLEMPEDAIVLTDIRVRLRQVEVKVLDGGWVNITSLPPSRPIFTNFAPHRLNHAMWKANKKGIGTIGKSGSTILYIGKATIHK